MSTNYTRQSQTQNSNTLLYAELTTTFSFSGLTQDVPNNIGVDSAINTGSDPVNILLNGTLNFNDPGNYLIVYHLNFTANSAAVASPIQILDQLIINAVVDPLYESARFTTPGSCCLERSRIYQASSGDTLNVRAWSSSNGTDNCSLTSFIAPGGVGTVPSFDIRVYKFWD